MPIATATALAIAGMGVSAGTQIYGAHKASSGSKKAAQIQTGAAEKARVEIDQAKKVADDIYAPYVASGRSVANTLGRLVTPGGGARYASPGPVTAPSPAPATGAVPRRSLGMGGRAEMGGGPAPNEGLAPRPRTIGSMVPRGGMVMMEAPDGSGARPVPESEVARFEAMGARRAA